MNARALVCVAAGHRWAEAEDVEETYPVLRCRRCGRLRKLTSESTAPEGWLERGGRSSRAGEFQDARIQRRP